MLSLGSNRGAFRGTTDGEGEGVAGSPLAQVTADANGHWRTHGLEEHLVQTGKLAAEFAQPLGNGDWGDVLGRWHDLGKYRPAFEHYIRAASGFDAHIETAPGRVDHSTAGALHSVARLGDAGSPGRLLAYCIAGHHAGLADWVNPDGGRALASRLSESNSSLLTEALAESPPESVLRAPGNLSPPPKGCDAALWTRTLFSALVDADFLETEAFMAPQRARLRRGREQLEDLLARFDSHRANLSIGIQS